MRGVWSLGGAVAAAATLGIIALAAGPAQDPLPEPMPAATIRNHASPFIPRGAGSCSAQACHGSAVPLYLSNSKALRNEHTTWITRDPHASAYEVLSSPRSASIAKNLGKASAREDARCLACHATPSAGSAVAEERSILLRDGVGCESCHGASSRWASEHTTYDWASKSADGKQASGFNDLRDLTRRAEVCAGCHVGAPAGGGIPLRDVNHDLIAAGHPRLTFEFSAYVANYPKHWDTSHQPADLPARLWKIGQVATLRAAVDLLRERAELASAKQAPWPELAEYSCFSCHFALKEIDPRANAFRGLRDADDPGEIGMPSWASWNLPMVNVLMKSAPEDHPVGLAPSLTRLRATMSRFEADPKVAADEAKALRAALDSWLVAMKESPLAPAELESIKKALDRRVEGGAGRS